MTDDGLAKRLDNLLQYPTYPGVDGPSALVKALHSSPVTVVKSWNVLVVSDTPSPMVRPCIANEDPASIAFKVSLTTIAPVNVDTLHI